MLPAFGSALAGRPADFSRTRKPCAAVARAARHAVAAGHMPQYRTLRANLPSMRIAERLGFQAYGFSSYVRLKP